MIIYTYIDGKNYKKILRELNLAQYPSLPQYLVDIKDKLEKKIKLTTAEELLTKSKLIKYFKDSKQALNVHEFDTFDWSLFDKRPPLPFQKLGIEFLAKNDGALLADEQGLGKSIQAICASKMFSDDYNILIVTLSGLKYNFANEISYFDNRISIITDKWLPDKYTIIHYEQLKKYKKEITNSKFDILIVDEAHKLKNPNSKRSLSFHEIQIKTKREIKKVWLLTGTPLDNKPIELFSILKLIKHPITKDYKQYAQKYCNGYIDMFGKWDVSGVSNLSDLHNQTKSCILRRLKSEVGNLPNKYRKPIFYEMTDIKGYKLALKDFLENKYQWIDEENEFPKERILTPLVKMMIWRQFCALKKIKDGHTIELIENELDQDKKIIVYSNFTKVIDSLHSTIGNKESVILDGRIPTNERFNLVDTFNKSKTQKVLITNVVGSTGYNIQSATSGIVNDLALVTSTMAQLEDRMYRIGQNKDVNIMYPIYQNTIEEVLYNLISDKMRIITTVIDGKEKGYFETNEYKTLFSQVEKVSKNELINEMMQKIDSMKFTF